MLLVARVTVPSASIQALYQVEVNYIGQAWFNQHFSETLLFSALK